MGDTSYCLNQFSLVNSHLTGILDVRYTDGITPDQLCLLTQQALPNAKIKTLYIDPVTKTDMKNDYDKSLLRIYHEENPNDKSHPYYSGGVSYSKAYSGKCVVFGMKGITTDIEDRAHQANEYVPLSITSKALVIYTRALYELSNDYEGEIANEE